MLFLVVCAARVQGRPDRVTEEEEGEEEEALAHVKISGRNCRRLNHHRQIKDRLSKVLRSKKNKKKMNLRENIREKLCEWLNHHR